MKMLNGNREHSVTQGSVQCYKEVNNDFSNLHCQEPRLSKEKVLWLVDYLPLAQKQET